MFVTTPFHNVHGRNNHRLSAKAQEAVCHPRVAQIVANTNPNFSPRGFPQILLFCRQSVFQELNGHALALLEDDVAVGADNKCRVVEISGGQGILASRDEKTLMLFAPSLNSVGDGAEKGVFAEDNDLGLGFGLN